MRPIRQGDVILLSVPEITGKKLTHLTLAEGEVTGHSHRISNGEAELYDKDGTLYLSILSKKATLSHEEHEALPIPQGNWMVRIQREYAPQKRNSPTPPRKNDSEFQDNVIPQTQEKRTKVSDRAKSSKQKVVSPQSRSNQPGTSPDLIEEIVPLPNSSPDPFEVPRVTKVGQNNWREVVD
ncbi:hypothetical protein NJ959_18440 [Symplocastrum sp. BBK-W-15]|uniref:Uncharacterized protein n=1 Tax=Limnofasciculus baicalensis BBK-W-15 TaxID=2699891 RepID=A0AAE3KND7_9CYAN|nr:hypothetical protein [Limnofasciculus baicalensis]MCP2730410.1 hypothetical protein [Limnofasciculus baicalensis BBK-W-15]